jgi:hypothetical protein
MFGPHPPVLLQFVFSWDLLGAVRVTESHLTTEGRLRLEIPGDRYDHP